jgi:NTP pyrophosphatase (non-canonical NTP hydrolase)
MTNKSQVRAKIEILDELISEGIEPLKLSIKRDTLKKELEEVDADIFESVLSSHKKLCDIKNMGEKHAFGHDPAVFYGLALSGECGELANNIIKVIRVGGSKQDKKEAIEKELPDVVIYSILLGYTSDIDIQKIVAEKSKIVVERAISGYYGGPLKNK